MYRKRSLAAKNYKSYKQLSRVLSVIWRGR